VGLESATRIVETLVVLMAQNIGSVEILFLWMPGRASLRIVLVIVVLGAVAVALSLDTVRILQLRRLVNRGRRGRQPSGRPPSAVRPKTPKLIRLGSYGLALRHLHQVLPACPSWARAVHRTETALISSGRQA